MSLKSILDGNKVWAEGVKRTDPEFFSRLAKRQNPPYLWIGCSDSRVPANQITNLLPGDIFVHRNIANQVFEGDVNLSAVLQFALESLRVRQVIVCGHYGCGGVEAAMNLRNIDKLSVVDTWLHGLKSSISEHEEDLLPISDVSKKVDKMCEINVLNQVRKLKALEIVKQAQRHGHKFEIHGLIYRIQDGLLHEI